MWNRKALVLIVWLLVSPSEHEILPSTDLQNGLQNGSTSGNIIDNIKWPIIERSDWKTSTNIRWMNSRKAATEQPSDLHIPTPDLPSRNKQANVEIRREVTWRSNRTGAVCKELDKHKPGNHSSLSSNMFGSGDQSKQKNHPLNSLTGTRRTDHEHKNFHDTDLNIQPENDKIKTSKESEKPMTHIKTVSKRQKIANFVSNKDNAYKSKYNGKKQKFDSQDIRPTINKVSKTHGKIFSINMNMMKGIKNIRNDIQVTSKKPKQINTIDMHIGSFIKLLTRERRQISNAPSQENIVKTYPLVLFMKVFESCMRAFRNSNEANQAAISTCCPTWKREKYQHYSKFVFPQYKDITCEKLSKFDSHGKALYQELVAKCSWQRENDNYKRLCEQSDGSHIMEKSPVYSNYTFLSYKNMYCALCHGEHPDHLTAFALEVDCNTIISKDEIMATSNTIGLFIESPDCKYKYITPSKSVLQTRNCLESSNVFTNCPSNIKVCERYSYPMVVFNGSAYQGYRNVLCARCDGHLQNGELTCKERSTDGVRTDGLKALFDFSNFIKIQHIREVESCPETQIKLGGEVGCVPLYCPDGMVPYFGNCIRLDEVTVSGSLLTLDLFVNGTTDISSLEKALHGFFVKALGVVSKYYKLYRTLFLSPNNFLSQFDIKIKAGTNYISGEACEIISYELNILTSGIETSGSDYWKNIISVNKDLLDLNIVVEENVHLQFNKDEENRHICVSDSQLELRRPFRHLWAKPGDNNLTCPSIEIREEYKFATKDGDLMNRSSIDLNETFLSGNRTLICVDEFFSKYEMLDSTLGMLEHIQYHHFLVHAIFSSLSITGLIGSLCHVLFITSLRNSNGVTIINLMGSMIITQTIFLVISDLDILDNTVCYWIGSLLHFLFLSMFTSMFLHALHITIQIRKMYVLRSKGYLRNMCLYVMPAYLFSSIIVGVTITLDKLYDPSSQWYGDGICFLSNSFGRFYFFSIPLAAILFSNIVCFCVMLKHLFSIKPVSKSQSHYAKRNNAAIALKFSASMGLSWILGFLATVLQSPVVWMCFEIACSLQGTFVSISFLLSLNVRQWYRSKIATLRSSQAISGDP